MLRIDCSVYRQILGVPGFTTVAVIREEVGVSLFITRIMQMIMSIKSVQECGNEFIQEIVEIERRGKYRWTSY